MIDRYTADLQLPGWERESMPQFEMAAVLIGTKPSVWPRIWQNFDKQSLFVRSSLSRTPTFSIPTRREILAWTLFEDLSDTFQKLVLLSEKAAEGFAETESTLIRCLKEGNLKEAEVFLHQITERIRPLIAFCHEQQRELVSRSAGRVPFANYLPCLGQLMSRLNKVTWTTVVVHCPDLTACITIRG